MAGVTGAAGSPQLSDSVYLKRGDNAGSEAFVAIAQIKTIDGPNRKADTREVTPHGPSVQYKEFAKALIDGGEVKLGLMFNRAAAGHNDLEDDLNDDVFPRNYQMLFPAGDTLQFAALVTGHAIKSSKGDNVMADVVFKVSGKPIWV